MNRCAWIPGVLTTLLCLPAQGSIPRFRGWLLLAVYAVWLVILLRQGS